MRINPKSQKGAIALMVLITMLFLMTFLLSLYIGTSNKAQMSTETTKEIEKKYNNIGDLDIIYNSYFATEDVIPIYNVDQLKKIGSGERIEIDGKIYAFLSNSNYILKNDLNLGGYYDTTEQRWMAEDENIWDPLPLSDEENNQYEFTGILDGMGHIISGIYINNEYDEQGLFGNLTGTIKNITIKDSFIGGRNFVGAIAGKNNGKIENCHNKAIVIGEDYVGGIAGNLSEDLINCTNTGNIIGDTNVTGGYFKSIETEDTIDVWNNYVLEENAYFVSGSYTATAPKGFKVSKNIFEQTIEDGMVVQDEDENEFVWVPVTYTATGETDANGLDTGFTATFKRINANNSNYSEPYENGYEGEVTEYYDMMLSVQNNGGFYIGRYEAGAQKIDVDESIIARTDVENKTSKIVVQRDQYPYIYVGWGTSKKEIENEIIYSDKNQGYGAVYLSKHFLDEKNTGAVSTLCYGVQWDAMLKFLGKENETDSKSWGNYANDTITTNRIFAKYTNDPLSDAIWNEITTSTKTSGIMTTGASDDFKIKNIYDVAGNCYEWTMETNSSGNRIRRGGSYQNTSSAYPASYRSNSSPNTCKEFLSFRPALYIK